MNKIFMSKKRKKAREYYLINDDSPFFVRESFKAARTNLLSILSTYSGPKQVCFTSPETGDGKTSTSANIAVTFAQMGAKVLLIDADMRKPKLHRVFSLKASPGLSNILSGFNTIDDCVQHSVYDGLDVITAGKIPPNPTELILSENFTNFLKQFDGVYDYVFIDAPPVCIVTDAVIISKKTLGCVLICKYGETRREMALLAKNEIEQFGGKIIGAVFNGIDQKRSKGYSSKYSYKYTYYNVVYSDTDTK